MRKSKNLSCQIKTGTRIKINRKCKECEKIKVKLQYKQAINISFELQEIFRQVFMISTNTVQQTELNNLTGQLIDRVKKVIHIFCRDLEDDMSDLKKIGRAHV